MHSGVGVFDSYTQPFACVVLSVWLFGSLGRECEDLGNGCIGLGKLGEMEMGMKMKMKEGRV